MYVVIWPRVIKSVVLMMIILLLQIIKIVDSRFEKNVREVKTTSVTNTKTFFRWFNFGKRENFSIE